MSTSRNARGLSWVLPLLFLLTGIVPASEGFFEVAGPLLLPEVEILGNVALTPDGLTLYFGANLPDLPDLPESQGGDDIWIARRERSGDENGEPVPFTVPFENLEEINSVFDERDVTISPDGKILYFVTEREEPLGDIWVAFRDTLEDEFFDPVPLTEVNSPLQEGIPTISRDGQLLFFHSAREGGLGIRDIWMATWEGPGVESFGEPVNLREINSTRWDAAPYCLDGRTLFFSSQCDVNLDFCGDNVDIYVARRDRIEDEHGNPVPFGRPAKVESLSMDSVDVIQGMSWDWPESRAQIVYGNGDFGKVKQLAVWHPDCNGNGQDDLEEIAAGDLEDMDRNGVPDACQDERRFLRGDCNGDGEVNTSDASCALERLFAGAAAPDCLAALNTNGDDNVNIADPVFLLNFLFAGGPRLSAPYPDCGPGTLPADKRLGCANPPDCQ